jgi:hypothetical protein
VGVDGHRPGRRRRGARGAALGAIAAIWLAVPTAGGQASPNQAEDVLLDDVGPGWSPLECPGVDATATGAITCFAADNQPSPDVLAMSAAPLPAGVDPLAFVEASAGGGVAFETTGLGVAEGRVIHDPGATTFVLVMVSEGFVFNLILTTSGTPDAQAQSFLLDVARRQQAAAGGQASASDASGSRSPLDRLLLTPPLGSGLEILTTGNAPLDVNDIRPQARSDAVVDLLADVPSRVRILSSGSLPAVVVTLEEHPYELFAAAGLASLAEQSAGSVLSLDDPTLPDGIAFRFPFRGDGIGIAFRRGSYLAILVAPALGAEATVSLETLTRLAGIQAGLLPEGDTEPYVFPAAVESISLTVGLTTALCGTSFGAGSFAAVRARRRFGRRGVPLDIATGGSDVVDVTERARALRRRGLALLVADLAAVNVAVVGALAVSGAVRMPTGVGWLLLAAALIGGISFTVRWARSEVRSIRDGTARGAELQPSAAALGGGLAAAALLVGGMALLTAGLAGVAFGPSLGDLERSKRFGVEPTLMSATTLVVGIALLVAGGSVVRLARLWARAGARRLRARDPRPPILYLRSFEDDALRVPAVVSARRPFLELFAARGSDLFEESIAWQIAPHGPVVAVARPGRSPRSLGAARDQLSDEVWREGVVALMAAARAIVVILGSTDGLAWEMARLVANGRLGATVFVFPPTAAALVRERWRFASEVLAPAASSAAPPTLPVPAEIALAAVLDPSGQWRVAVSDARDEATFRVALDQAMAWLDEGAASSASTRSVDRAMLPTPPPAVPDR